MLNVREKTNWLTLLRAAGSMDASGEGDLGAAMLRLATLAAEMHRKLEAEELVGGWVAQMLDEEDRAHGRARSHVVPAMDRGPEGTEACR